MTAFSKLFGALVSRKIRMYTSDIVVLLLLVLPLALLTYVFLFNLRRKTTHHPLRLRTATVLVLGDIGRSPRMMYHAESLASSMNLVTHVVGYSGSKPTPALEILPKVQIHHLAQLPKTISSLSASSSRFIPRALVFAIQAPLKVIYQVYSILDVLLFQIREAPEFLLVQNPPTIPTLAIASFVGWARGSKVIIDWHNLGYSILALKLGNNEKHPFVRIAKWFERYFGRKAFAHIFVTDAMCEYLSNEWNLVGHKLVLHDRPPRHFHRCSPQECHDLFMKLEPRFTSLRIISHNDKRPTTHNLRSFLPEFSSPYTTPLTSTHLTHSGSITAPTLRSDRPALVVSSTSWTPDEDFGILLGALKGYEARAKLVNDRNQSQEGGSLPKLMMVVTGKGPLRAKYMEQVRELEKGWKSVRCVSMWLESMDYPLLLGCADLGISLHSSSSNLDLPMKVVDMFGCGLPVCALDFKCLGELVKPGINGLTFKTADELVDQLQELLTSFPTSSTKLASLRTSILAHTESTTAQDDEWEWGTWEDNWNKRMKPLLLDK